MKREEIKAGEEYLVGTHHTWATGHYRNEFVRVLDISRGWAETKSVVTPRGYRSIAVDTGAIDLWMGYREDILGRQSAKGVLVSILGGNGEHHRYAVYDPKYFRVTAQEGRRILDDWAERQRQTKAALAQLRAEEAERFRQVQKRAEAFGLAPARYGNLISLDMAQFERVLDLLEKERV